jgi:predicted HicB family RNase H-like nuclease
MYTKLTLNIDQNVIENAKKYAKHQKRSVSKLAEEYLS